MVIVGMILAAIALLASSGVPACLPGAAGRRVGTMLVVTGSVLGLGGVAAVLGSGDEPSWSTPWLLPWGRFAVAIDPISAVFLMPVLIVPAVGSVFGLGYWSQKQHPTGGRRLVLSYGLLAAAMALVVVARDGVLFLISWELMALAAFFAATAEDARPEVRQAGWVYLVATHAGTLCLIAFFTLWRSGTGSFALESAPDLAARTAAILFVLALIGFGLKAGLMPLHVWLPGAHASAPSHVSAVMSGVLLKMGVYGIVRITALLPAGPAWWGGVLLAVGATTAVAGIAFALAQHDLKRLLAYSSIENVGIIAVGLGLAVLGRSLGRPDWVLLGLCGALLHVWNHGLIKSLLFLGAGALIHATHTQSLDQLGGLARRMPVLLALFLAGALGVCALPPLNGFASEWLIYLGLFRTLEIGGTSGVPAVALAAVALAMVGALTIACFVKVVGTVFLGTPRGTAASQGHDPGPLMLAPMAVLAAGCGILGLFPVLAVPLLERATHAWAGPDSAALPLRSVAPLRWISLLGLALVAMSGATVATLWTLISRRRRDQAGTWDCGYARPTARMQYSGSSLGQTVVGLFRGILWPRNQWPALRDLFPAGTRAGTVVPDVILDRLVLPFFRLAGSYLPRIRVLQQGRTQLYLLYILVIMIVLLVGGTMGGEP